jgi:hypothetical protein
MNTEPFAYGIQAPIGSVTPLFHKRNDAEDYIAKLTDSRAAAKIIPLYRAPTLTDAEREAVATAAASCEGIGFDQLPAALRGLLERLK